MRIAFHAINGVGLGHLVRAISIAKEVRAIAPQVELLVVTTALDTSLLRRADLDFVQLPPRLGEPHADPDRSRVALPEPLERAALDGVFAAFAPDLVVFDTHAPMHAVRALHERGARSVLVLRELRPDALRAFIARGDARWFARIIVPHDASDLDTSALAGLPYELVGAVVRLGGARRSERNKAAPARTPPRILAMAGGGGQPVDAARYLQAVADAHCLARASVPDLETTLVTGPYGEAPRRGSSFPGLTIRRSPRDLDARMREATLVVSQAGYNAVAEIRALQIPAVLVPGHRKAEDQRARALRLARAGAAVIARPEARSIADAALRILETKGALAAMRRAHAAAPLDIGNRRAAEALLRPILRPAGPVTRVALVAHDFAPKLGGMETVALALARGLLDRGVDVRVYTADRLGARVASGLPDGVVRPIFDPLPGARRIDLRADLLATIDAISTDPVDVVHLCHAGLGAWIPALRASTPAVVTVHVHGNDLLAPWVHHEGPVESYQRAVTDGLSAAHAVVAVSRFSRGLAAARGVPDETLSVIENGVDTRRFCPGPRDEALARRLGLGPADEVMLSVSRLAPRKGHRTVIAALARLAQSRPRLRFVFTGANDALARELFALAEQLGVRDRLVATGFLATPDLPALYRLADVFVLAPDSLAPDDVEGFGVALLEAAATGAPTVGSRVGGVPEAIEEGVTGLLAEPGDAASLAGAVRAILGDEAYARALGERGRARVVARFDEGRATSALLARWSSIAARAEIALSRDTDGAELVRSARDEQTKKRAGRARRRDELAALAARGRVVRLQATNDGACRLPAALDDCAAIGIRPRVEVKLRRFLEPDFDAFARPLVESVELVHGVPHGETSADGDALLARVRSARERLGAVRTVRLFLTPEARLDPALALRAVPEVHALRALFRDAGALVVPPHELMRYLSETPAGGPETAMIEPTNLCNLACPTCPTGTGKIKPLPSMTTARFARALGELGPQVRNLALWNYGEPLLNKHLPEIIAHAKQAGVSVVKVSSNVHFLDGERGRALLSSGLDVLILSVDGASQATYATFRKDGDFETVARSVAWLTAEKRRLGSKKPRIELQFIAMRHNQHEIPEMRRLAREWGVDKLRIKTVGADDPETRDLIPTDRLLSRYDATATRPNTRHALCTMAWDHTVINVDGSVTPCCYLRPDMGDSFVMGNVFETTFAEIWRGPRYRKFRREMLAGRESMPVCDRCRGGTHDLLAAVEEVERP